MRRIYFTAYLLLAAFVCCAQSNLAKGPAYYRDPEGIKFQVWVDTTTIDMAYIYRAGRYQELNKAMADDSRRFPCTERECTRKRQPRQRFCVWHSQ